MSTENCWNEIGVGGDRSCKQLETVRHCLNCPVYTEAGRRLLDREIPPDYLQEWTHILAQPMAAQTSIATAKQQYSEHEQSGKMLSAIIFRLGNERFALPVSVLHEVTRPSPIHTLPHHSTPIFLGLVNNRGEILPCVSLSQFLQIEMPIDPTYSRIDQKRMIVINDPEVRWVFPVDEVHRVHRFHPNELQTPPVVVTKAHHAFTQGIFEWHDLKVNYLDADRLLTTLDRRLL